jgi:Dyp-type peroxidase family
VGGPKNEAAIVLILASDHVGVLDDLVALLKLRAHDAALDLIFEQRGDTLPGDLRGHEHFGFKDGISQPGVRGKLSAAPGDYITPRYIAAGDDRRLYIAKPGQQLVWPGQFLLGEQRQSTEDQLNAIAAGSNFPNWAKRGSYLVVRRLQQDVPAFYSFVARGAARTGIGRDKFAAMLVGRWPSGAPILRLPGGDNPALGDDDFANNHFIFDDDTRPSSLRPIPGYPGDTYPQAAADFLAQVCPHFAHIRKVHPRDTATEMGKPADTFTRMILRRGIPYGPQLVGVKKPTRKLIGADRGLMFLCYGASIEDQFEFLQRRWSNSASQPNLGGFDPIIGQSGRRGSRIRFIDCPTPAGTFRIKMQDEWVTPTGGGYFFAPSISAIRDVLAA